MQKIKDKVAFITGGGSGIGLGMARAFSAAGMKVIIADIRRDNLDRAMDVLGEAAEIHPIQLDVTDREAFAAAADEAEQVFGRVHVLCNNAGIGIIGPLRQATWDDWDWNMNVNIGGVINGVQTFLPRMLAHGEGGHIVNTASTGGLYVHGGAGLYCTAKFAVVGLSEALRGELAQDNIGVSAFCPGPTEGRLVESGKTRPAHLSHTGYAEIEKQRQQRAGYLDDVRMPALEAGRRVLEGIRHNDLYIITHPEFRDGIRARCDAVLEAVPQYAPDPKRVKAISFLLSNPIYDYRREVD